MKEHSDSKNKYTEEDIDARVSSWQHFRGLRGKGFPTDVGIPMGTKCAPLLADIFLYSYEAEFIQSLLPVGKKRLASQFNFTSRYIDDVLSINNPDFENYLCKIYPPELEIKDTTESNTSASYFDLLLSIGTVNFALPFTTNVTLSISILQNFRFWVATSHLRLPMAYLSHNLSDIQGLAPLMNVLFLGRCDFPISFLKFSMSVTSSVELMFTCCWHAGFI